MSQVFRTIFGYLVFSLAIIGLYFLSREPIQSDTTRPPKNQSVVNFLDVGQGDAIYVRINTGEDALIDGGPDSDKGVPPVLTELSQVMPFFDKELDLLIITHNHADHIGGLDEVLKKYQVKEIWLSGAIHTTQSYLRLLEEIKKEKADGAQVKKVKLGDRRQLGRATIAVLFPAEDQEGQSPKDQHEATIVTKLTDDQISFLLAGDINEDHEAQILQAFRDHLDFLRSPILKIPHHGSKTALAPEFLQVVSPEVAVISVGAHNPFHHPVPAILTKLQSINAQIYRTDRNGRVAIVSNGEKFEVHVKKSSSE